MPLSKSLLSDREEANVQQQLVKLHDLGENEHFIRELKVNVFCLLPFHSHLRV